MSPQRVLSLWRERWSKSAGAPRRIPYVDGKINLWGQQLAASPVWGVPLLAGVVGGLCVLLLVYISTLALTQTGQTVFSVSILGLALFFRRYHGTFVTLLLLALSLVASSRYLFWRLTGTLVEDFSWDFILGFVLWAAELHFCALFGLKLVARMWPIQRDIAALPEDHTTWPTVDIFVPCLGQSYPALVVAANAAMALDWPYEKIKIYLLDGAARAEVAELAGTLGIQYLSRELDGITPADGLHHALRDARGQLVVVLEVGQAPKPDFLKRTAGEFLHDAHLGMLHTAGHFLTPPLSPRCRSHLGVSDAGGSCAIFRRSALLEEDGVLCESVMSHTHTALNLDALGYNHACIGFTPQDGVSEGPFSVFLVDKPFLNKSLWWRQRCASLRDGLQFYYPLARAVFYTTPVIYLLALAYWVPVSGVQFVAYALPHLCHGLMFKDRLHSPTRIGLWAYLRETLLAWYVFLCTALALTQTLWGKWVHTAGASDNASEGVSPIRGGAGRTFVGVMAIVVVGLVATGARFSELSSGSGFQGEDGLILFSLWNGYHFFALMAAFAVVQETRHIALHQDAMSRMSAVVRLASGRSISCATQNFPGPDLGLQLPVGVVVDAQEVERISLLLGGREFVFPVSADSPDPGVLKVRLREGFAPEFAMLVKMSRSRGENWPKFLPGENADRPFPPWLTAPIVKLFTRARDFLADLVINWSKKK